MATSSAPELPSPDPGGTSELVVSESGDDGGRSRSAAAWRISFGSGTGASGRSSSTSAPSSLARRRYPERAEPLRRGRGD